MTRIGCVGGFFSGRLQLIYAVVLSLIVQTFINSRTGQREANDASLDVSRRAGDAGNGSRGVHISLSLNLWSDILGELPRRVDVASANSKRVLFLETLLGSSPSSPPFPPIVCDQGSWTSFTAANPSRYTPCEARDGGKRDSRIDGARCVPRPPLLDGHGTTTQSSHSHSSNSSTSISTFHDTNSTANVDRPGRRGRP